jgi:hypothetical protein
MTNLELSTEAWLDKKSLKRFFNGVGQVLFHVLLVALSAGIALSLPYVVGFIGNNFWDYWSIIEKETVYLISVETIIAIVLLLVFNYIGRSWKDHQISKMAKSAGLVYFLPAKNVFAQKKMTRLKRRQGFARDVMIISSTGYRTFVDPRGELHSVLQHCRGARIMLLNPRSEGAHARARSILDPNVTPETFSEQVKKSVDFLKGLRAGKNIRLKLYDDTPFLKLAILGDHVWIKHYHPGLDVESMPEYLFEHDQNLGGFYTPFYHYFLARWENPAIAEYDLETHELIYRDASGKEISREKTDMLYKPSDDRQVSRQELFPLSLISPS